MSIKISIVVTAHHEGILAHRTMRSLQRAVVMAESEHVACERIVVLDRPDEATREFFDAHSEHYERLVTVDEGDLGSARNHGVNAATGRYVAFLESGRHRPGRLTFR